uniref:Uncharacterized protein n=1 Tax=Alexandrium monilatum TaxID=311494 RepID=A0A7S4QRW5_9DINO|mmetsp:Transcript_74489/g.235331  ORF Transcript_74489/g.235331 Transcript_74489/m.235331 type:complete len:250 (+) Transcript_74489:53-802(+)
MAQLANILCLAGLVTSSAALDDPSGLLQSTVHQSVHVSQAPSAKGPESRPVFDCQKHPGLCKEPFNCQDYTGDEWHAWKATGVERVQLKTWCAAAQYETFITTCLAKKDPVSAAKLQFELTAGGAFGNDVAEYDGSYCFLEGHCVNSEVNENTTMEDAEAMCDRKLGQSWRRYASDNLPAEDRIGGVPLPPDGRNGFTNRGQVRPFVIMACAMGNLHCDINYCKETYCQMPYYKDKYGHLLKEHGWVKD